MIHENIKDFAKLIEKNRPIISLDVGNSGIGIAVSDVLHIVATPDIIYTRRNISKDMGYLAEYIKNLDACALVVGLPLNLNGGEGENCELIRNFCKKLNKKTDLPIFLQDERMSTASSDRMLKEFKMTRKKRNSIDDKVAASYILQVVLDSLQNISS